VRTRVGNFLANNKLFAVVLAVGAALRLITILGFPPAIWYGGDSVSYVNSGLHWFPGTSRESGYGVFLELLQWTHSFAVVTAIQHLAGLAMGVLIYCLLRARYRLPAWGAALATLPVLLDPYVIQLEQEILADSLFTFLCVCAVTLVLWWPDRERPAWSLPLAALLLGIASAFWPVGLPLLIILGVYMLVRWFGWQTLIATVIAGALPLVVYLGWFDSRYNHLAFNYSDGVFLWSRTMSFANCQVIKPPADLRPLCPTGPASARQQAPFYIWESNSPILKVGGTSTSDFTRTRNRLGEKFAIDAIKAQPLSYANVVFRGWMLSYSWDRPAIPSPAMADRYQFSDATQSQNLLDSGTSETASLARVQRQYTDGHGASTHENQPFADVMIGYQRYLYMRGTMLGLLMLIGLAGIVRSWRAGGFRRRQDWGGPALFPFVAALTMEIIPPATADFSLRYVVPTIPVICITAALAFARPLSGRAPKIAVPQQAASALGALAGEGTDGGEPTVSPEAAVSAETAVGAERTAGAESTVGSETTVGSESTGPAGNTA
jgi:hypothetical protein